MQTWSSHQELSTSARVVCASKLCILEIKHNHIIIMYCNGPSFGSAAKLCRLHWLGERRSQCLGPEFNPSERVHDDQLDLHIITRNHDNFGCWSHNLDQPYGHAWRHYADQASSLSPKKFFPQCPTQWPTEWVRPYTCNQTECDRAYQHTVTVRPSNRKPHGL